MDRISELPIHIIHQIMSQLSAKEVAQTNLLSKKFKDEICPSFPILIFDQDVFMGTNEPSTKTFKNFSEIVYKTLKRFNEMKLPMHKFDLMIGVNCNFESLFRFMDDWIGLALENQVKKLRLSNDMMHRDYPLPEKLFLANSITVLSLYSCNLDHPQFSHAFRLQSLRKLALRWVRLDELMIQKITSNSPLLEKIYLGNCEGFEHCHVPMHQRLRVFRIFEPFDYIKSIEVTAPNLDKCDIFYYELERPPIRISLSGCNNLTSLSLSGDNLIGDKEFYDLIAKLPSLEELEVEDSDILRSVSISSQTLKKVIFIGCNSIKAICFDTPNLLHFNWRGLQIPGIASINAPFLVGQFLRNNRIRV